MGHHLASSAYLDDAATAPLAAGAKVRLRLVVHLLLVTLVAAAFCLWRTGASSFAEGDQTTHTLVVQEMYKSGNWLHPRSGDRPYLNKPPLKMWFTLVPLHLLGESNLSYRIIDGLSGIGIALALFLFARRLFGGALAGYLSVIALMGCDLFFFGHGVRNAVQDSLMHLFVTLAIIAAWRYSETIRRDGGAPQERAFQIRLAAATGICIGLAAMCKGAGALVAFVIMGSYAVLTLHRHRLGMAQLRDLLLVIALSALPLGSYILLQGELADNMLRMMFVHETYKRAIRGYHNVHQHWLYWKVITGFQLTVPPLLLGAAFGFALWRYLGKKELRYLFLLCWAVAPIVMYQLVRSKLTWYILPSVPAMCLLIGGMLSAACHDMVYQFGRSRSCRSAALAAFLACSLVMLGAHAANVQAKVLAGGKRKAVDLLSEELLAYQQERRRPLTVLVRRDLKLTKHEELYFRMLDLRRLSSEETAALPQVAAQGADLVLATVPDMHALSKIPSFSSYRFLRPAGRRAQWLYLASFLPDRVPQGFTAARQSISFGQKTLRTAFGWKPQPGAIHGVSLRASLGAASAVLLTGDLAMRRLGTAARISMASNVPEADGDLDVLIYLNDRHIATLEKVRQGFAERRFTIPPNLWQRGENLFGLVYRFRDGRQTDDKAELVLVEKLDLELGAR